MNIKILSSVLALVLLSTVVFAQEETVTTQPPITQPAITAQQQQIAQQYEAIKQQLLSMMTDEEKEAFLALTPQEQIQFIDRQIALANLRWQSEVLVDCGGVCVEGLPAVWQLKLSNLGPSDFLLQSIAMLDDYGNIFAQRAVNLTIPSNQVGTINVQGILPPPSRSSTLFYRVMFVIDGNVQSEQGNRRMSLMPLADIECADNTTCKKDEFCLGFKCVPLTALPANKTERQKNIFESDSILYPIVIIILLAVIIGILLTRKAIRRKSEIKKF